MIRFSIAVCILAIALCITNLTSGLILGGMFYLFSGGYYWVYLFSKTIRRDMNFVLFGVKLVKYIGSMKSKNYTVVDVFSQTVMKHPGKVAIISADSGKKMTFQEMEDFINKIANIFQSLGFKRGDVIGLYMRNEIEYVPIWLGLSKIGVVTALLNCNLTDDALKHCINAGNCKSIIYHCELKDQVKTLKDSLVEMTYYVFGEDEDISGDKSLTEMIGLASSVAPVKPDGVTLENDMLYIYTSGTTGLPKAVIMKGRRIILALLVSRVIFVKEDDIVYNTLPMYHSSGTLVCMAPMLISGATTVIRKKFSASRFFRDCVQYNVTYIGYIGEICRYLLLQPESEFDKTNKVKTAVGNGMRRSMFQRFKERFGIEHVYEFYGATEGNVGVINNVNKDGAVGYLLVSLWFLNMKKLIRVDRETGDIIRNENGFAIECKPCEPGMMVGSIFKGHDFDGYVDKLASRKKVAKNVFRKGDSVFLSGDLLEIDELGYLYFVDRLGDTFRWKGENVSTTEVENIICKLVNLNDVLVYSVVVPGVEGRAGVAYIVHEHIALDIASLTNGLKMSLPKYAIPMFLRIGKHVPITGTQKHQKGNLRKEGFTPANLGTDEELYFYDVLKCEYKHLDAEFYDQIMNGKIKF